MKKLDFSGGDPLLPLTRVANYAFRHTSKDLNQYQVVLQSARTPLGQTLSNIAQYFNARGKNHEVTIENGHKLEQIWDILELSIVKGSWMGLAEDDPVVRVSYAKPVADILSFVDRLHRMKQCLHPEMDASPALRHAVPVVSGLCQSIG